MRATDSQGSFLNRITIIRRNSQVVSMENNHGLDLELFQRHVADRFSDLDPVDDPLAQDQGPLLSISWFRKLLDVFLLCEDEFKAAVLTGRDPSQLSKPPLDRLLSDLLDRSVKALDVCNAVTHGIELVRHWQKLAQIAVTALEQKPLGDGSLRRAKKGLNALLASMMVDDKESSNNTNGKFSERTWSFSRHAAGGGGGGATGKEKTAESFRSMSWSVAKSWSAARQIQAMSSNLVAPRGWEPTALPVYVMSTVLVFVMWALVAAIPCQERTGLPAQLSTPRQLGWAQSLIGLQEKIGEVWKKKEKKGTCGLLEEVQRMEKVAQSLLKLTDSYYQLPFEEEKAEEVAVHAAEIGDICRKMEEGLLPLQQQVREVFHRIMRSRAEILNIFDQVRK